VIWQKDVIDKITKNEIFIPLCAVNQGLSNEPISMSKFLAVSPQYDCQKEVTPFPMSKKNRQKEVMAFTSFWLHSMCNYFLLPGLSLILQQYLTYGTSQSRIFRRVWPTRSQLLIGCHGHVALGRHI